MISYRDIASKNIVTTSFVERKTDNLVEETKEETKKSEITCQYCGDSIDYWEDDYCEYEEQK